MPFPFKLLALALCLAAALVFAAFFWNEARKEVEFLCANFGGGVTKQSVTEQLDTGVFLRYRIDAMGAGERIVADSPLNLGIYRCTVKLDTQGSVLDARFE